LIEEKGKGVEKGEGSTTGKRRSTMLRRREQCGRALSKPVESP